MSFSVKPLLFIKAAVIVAVLASGQATQAQVANNDCNPFVNGQIQPEFSCSQIQTKRTKRPTRPRPQLHDWRQELFDNAISSGAGSDGGNSGGSSSGGTR